MTTDVVYYRKIVNGVGYRFELPLLALPPPNGDLVDIELTVFSEDVERLLYAPVVKTISATRACHTDDCATLDVTAAGAYWLLPLLSPTTFNGQHVYVVKARRVPPYQETSAPQTSSASIQSTPYASHCLASVRSANSTPTPAAAKASDKGEASREASSMPLHSSAQAISPSPSRASSNPTPCSDESSCSESDTSSSLDSDSGENVFDEVELNLNGAYNNCLSKTRYVDVLPQSDPPSAAKAGSLDPRLHDPKRWSVNKDSSTWFRLTSIKRRIAKLDWWHLLDGGLPCKIRGQFVEVYASGCSAHELRVTTTALCDGGGRYKLAPIDSDEYACQPAAASAEASHILNSYEIIIEQNGEDHRAFQPSGQLLDFEWESHLRILAQYSSARGARSLLYSEDSHWDGISEFVNGFGVRLRDGGSRLPLRRKAAERGVFEVELPGIVALYRRWGTCGTPSASSDDSEDNILVDVRLPVGPGEHDLLLRVRERKDGAYRKIDYAVRARGSFEAVQPGDWRPLGSEMMDVDARRYIVNVARSTFGRPLLEKTLHSEDTPAAKKLRT